MLRACVRTEIRYDNDDDERSWKSFSENPRWPPSNAAVVIFHDFIRFLLLNHIKSVRNFFILIHFTILFQSLLSQIRFMYYFEWEEENLFFDNLLIFFFRAFYSFWNFFRKLNTNLKCYFNIFTRRNDLYVTNNIYMDYRYYIITDNSVVVIIFLFRLNKNSKSMRCSCL